MACNPRMYLPPCRPFGGPHQRMEGANLLYTGHQEAAPVEDVHRPSIDSETSFSARPRFLIIILMELIHTYITYTTANSV